MGTDLMVSLSVTLMAAIVLWSPAILRRRLRAEALALVALTAVMGFASWSTAGALVFLALGAASALQSWQSREAGRAAMVTLGGSAIASAAAGALFATGNLPGTFIASSIAIALRAGLVPFHAGVAALCDRAAHRQVEQSAVLVLAMLAHLRFADHIPLAYDLAPMLVRTGALMTLLPGLVALVQRDLRGFYRAASVMHGGMIVAAMGAAGRGHYAAALMVALTTAIALGGLGLMVIALEERAGAVSLNGPGGRVQSFPRLAAGFALFGAAGVAMPGTAGFIADDLMLHALWGESVGATVMIILGAALLAVGTLRAYAGAFLGPARPSLAPDLRGHERALVTILIVLLLVLGLVPGILLTPADAMLRIDPVT